MKKIIIFLITLLAVLPRCVNAETKKFYEGEYIDDVWINKVTPDGKTIYYQKARFFKEAGTNNIAYCIEPFKMFNENTTYESTLNPNNLSIEQKERISLLAFLGYGYKFRQDKVWYAVTQLLIWQTADPTGNYYFTDSLNGNKTSAFQSKIDELNMAVDTYKKNTLTNQSHEIVLGEKIEIIDNNKHITTYVTGNKYTKIKGNKIIIENLPLGIHHISLKRIEEAYNTPLVFYQSPTSQNLLTLGNLEPQEIIIDVNVKDTNVKILKQDYDTGSTTPSGNAKLENAKFEIYDSNMTKLKEITLDKTLEANIPSLPIGKYHIKEIAAGIGYEIDPNIYEFELTKDKPYITILLKNKVIKAKVEIDKVYITNDNEFPEENITFGIYSNQNELVKEITTDKFGHCETILPYGTYSIKQLSTKEGYTIIEPFQIIIKDNLTLSYNLKNYQIEVPNTYIETLPLKRKVLNFIKKLIGQIYDYKIINNTISNY